MWPIVGSAAALAYIWMSIRWLLDLSTIERQGGAHAVWQALALRWLPVDRRLASRVESTLVDLAVMIGRVGLIAVLVTVAVTVVVVALRMTAALVG